MKQLLDELNRLIEPIRRRVRLIVARAVVTLVKDSTGIQTCQLAILAGEIRDDVERLQEFGFSSVPLPGAEAVVVFAGGNRDHGIIVGVEDRKYRPTGMAAGEVQLYSAFGAKIYLKADGAVEVTRGSGTAVSSVIMAADGSVAVARGSGTAVSSVTMAADGSVAVARGSGATASSLTMAADGGLDATGKGGSIKLTAAGQAEVNCTKVKIGSPSAELVALLATFVDAVIAGQTAVGPLVHADFAVVKTALATIKV
jgi:phage baseplate assembly protein V